MTGPILYPLLFMVAFRWQLRRQAAPLAVSRATVFAVGGPALLLSVLARFGIAGGFLAGVLAPLGFILLLLVAARRERAVPQQHSAQAFLIVGLALSAALVCPRPWIGAESIARDGYAHLAWSRDLVAANGFYVPGFPAFLSTLTPGDALVGAFRVAPALLLVALFLVFVGFGAITGWTGAGLAGCAAAVAMPVLASRLTPALPELMAWCLIVASWTEWMAFRGGARDTPWWLGGISLALVVTHVSILELAHFAALSIALLVSEGTPVRRRVGALGAMVSGAALAFVVAPVLGRMAFGEGLLLMHEQPSRLGQFSFRALGGGWGLAVDVALLLTALGLLRDPGRAWSAATRLWPFGLASSLLLGPLFLSGLGVEFPIQVFDDRLYAAAALFVVLGWIVGLAHLHRMRPRWAAIAAGLPVLGIVVRFVGAPLFLVFLGVASCACAAVARPAARRGRIRRAVTIVALLAAVMAARLLVWTPEDPAWVHALRQHDGSAGVLLTHWPSFNAAQARADIGVEVGIAGADAGLPLHALRTMPELRSRLRWAADSGPQDRRALGAWILAHRGEDVLILLHRDLGLAWSGYARVYRRRQAAGLAAGALVYREEPVEVDPMLRIRWIENAIRSLGPVEVLHADEEATLFRVRPGSLGNAPPDDAD